MSDLLAMIDRTAIECRKANEEPRDLLIPERLEPMMKDAFGIHLRYPHPVEWETYAGMNIKWTAGVTQLSIRTSSGDVRICK